MPRSWKYEVRVLNDPKFYSNGVAFPTQEEADAAGYDKLTRWTLCDAYRVVESDEPANYRWSPTTGLERIEGAA